MVDKIFMLMTTYEGRNGRIVTKIRKNWNRICIRYQNIKWMRVWTIQSKSVHQRTPTISGWAWILSAVGIHIVGYVEFFKHICEWLRIKYDNTTIQTNGWDIIILKRIQTTAWSDKKKGSAYDQRRSTKTNPIWQVLQRLKQIMTPIRTKTHKKQKNNNKKRTTSTNQQY